MRYYTIQNNSILIANNEQALNRFYDGVLPLPNDYEEEKYIAQDGELVLNPEWEQVQKNRRKLEIQNKIKELNEYSMDYMRIGDKAGLDIINNIISGLEVELTN